MSSKDNSSNNGISVGRKNSSSNATNIFSNQKDAQPLKKLFEEYGKIKPISKETAERLSKERKERDGLTKKKENLNVQTNKKKVVKSVTPKLGDNK